MFLQHIYRVIDIESHFIVVTYKVIGLVDIILKFIQDKL